MKTSQQSAWTTMPDRQATIGDKKGRAVARVYTSHPDHEKTQKLFIASLDLLEACQVAKKYLEPELKEPGASVFWKLVRAIEKAGAANWALKPTIDQTKTTK